MNLVAPLDGETLNSANVEVGVAISSFIVDHEAFEGANQDGHGHWKMFLNAAFVQASYESQIVLKPLPRGTHNLRVVLANNDHSLVNPVVEAGFVINKVSGAKVTANELELDY